MEWKLSPGDRGPAVRVMQALLNMRGGLASPVPENGVFDAATAVGLAAFQRSKGLQADTGYTMTTRRALVGKLATGAETAAWPAPWMDIAAAEAAAGIKEDPRPGKNEDRIIEYHSVTKQKYRDDETAWCSSFANWVLGKAGYRTLKNPGAVSWIKWGIQSPDRFGAIAVIRSGNQYHVGFFIDRSKTEIRLLGGNQGPDKEGMVKELNYRLRSFDVAAIRWPAPNDEPAQP